MAEESNYTKNYAASADEQASQVKARQQKPGKRDAAKAKAKGRSAAQAKVKAASEGAGGASASASKKGLVVGIVVLVVVIVVAAVAYNVLAPGAQPQSLQTQGEATQRVGDGTGESGPDGAAGSTDGAGGASGEDADAGKTAAPDFEMTAVDGGKVSLDDLKGKPVVLNFWASTCGPCKMEMPEFQAAYEQYGDQLQFVMLNVPDFNGETRERALQLVEQSGYTFPVYFDDTTQGQVLYGITSIPQTYFINADGTVEAYASGAIDASTLERGIEMVLA